MKNRFFAIVLMLIILLCGCDQDSTVEEQVDLISVDSVCKFRDIEMFGECGWAMTIDGELMHTNGGLKEFEVVVTPNMVVRDEFEVSFYNASTSYLTCYNYVDDKIDIVFTKDGGITWECSSIPAPMGNGGSFISMVNENEGYLLYSTGANPITYSLYKTTDGGKTFIFENDIINVNNYPRGFTVTDDGVGYIATDLRNVKNTTLYTSKDLLDWQEVEFGLNNKYFHYVSDVPAFYGKNNNNGVMFLWERVQNDSIYRTYIFSTKDGGLSWNEILMLPRSVNAGRGFTKISVNHETSQIYMLDEVGTLYELSID